MLQLAMHSDIAVSENNHVFVHKLCHTTGFVKRVQQARLLEGRHYLSKEQAVTLSKGLFPLLDPEQTEKGNMKPPSNINNLTYCTLLLCDTVMEQTLPLIFIRNHSNNMVTSFIF